MRLRDLRALTSSDRAPCHRIGYGCCLPADARARAQNVGGTGFSSRRRPGWLHQLRKANPGTEFMAVNDRAVCRYMKMITAEKLLRSLREEVVQSTFLPRSRYVRGPPSSAWSRSDSRRLVANGPPSSKRSAPSSPTRRAGSVLGLSHRRRHRRVGRRRSWLAHSLAGRVCGSPLSPKDSCVKAVRRGPRAGSRALWTPMTHPRSISTTP